jgi:hypothetical protein
VLPRHVIPNILAGGIDPAAVLFMKVELKPGGKLTIIGPVGGGTGLVLPDLPGLLHHTQFIKMSRPLKSILALGRGALGHELLRP